MRPVLETLLCHRYPDLFRQTELPMTQTCMCWGFTHQDGWFAIIDALAETIAEIDPTAEARQVKEKLGTLRFYCDSALEAVDDAIVAAEEFSGRVCEETGALGRLISLDGWLQTRSAEKIAQLDARPGSERRRPNPETDADLEDVPGSQRRPTLEARLQMTTATAIESLKRRHPRTFAQTKQMAFPARFYDLIDVAAGLISNPLYGPRHSDQPRIAIDRVSWNRLDGLRIDPSFISIRRYAKAAVAAEAAAQAAAPDLRADTNASEAAENDATAHTRSDRGADPKAVAGINAAVTDALRGIGFAFDEPNEDASTNRSATDRNAIAAAPRAGAAGSDRATNPDVGASDPDTAGADPDTAGADPDTAGADPDTAGVGRSLSADPSSPDEPAAEGNGSPADQNTADQDEAAADARERVSKLTKELAGQIQAVISFVTAMSLRMDPETGSCGPVDAQGRLILPEHAGPKAPDLLDHTRQVSAILTQFDRGWDYRPHVFCKNRIRPSLEVREHIAGSIRAGTTKVLLPRIYRRPSRRFPIPGFDQARYQIVFALAEQHGWHIALPVEMGQFFMGRGSRPTTLWIDRFFYDQPTERRFDTEPPFTLLPAQDNRIFELNAASQAVFQHIQLHPEATDEALLDDARFAASSWLAEPALKTGLAQDLNAGRLKGKEAFLAHAILWTAQTLPPVQSRAPAGFDPALHEDKAPRIYGWSIEKGRDGELYLRADHIENHPEIGSQEGLRRSTNLVWYDLQSGWARTRSRYYRLIGEQRR